MFSKTRAHVVGERADFFQRWAGIFCIEDRSAGIQPRHSSDSFGELFRLSRNGLRGARKGNLRLDRFEDATAKLKDDATAIAPEKPQSSGELVCGFLLRMTILMPFKEVKQDAHAEGSRRKRSGGGLPAARSISRIGRLSRW